MKHIDTSTIGYTLQLDVFEHSDFISMPNELSAGEVKVTVESDDIRLKSTSTTENFKKFTKKYFF